LKDHAGGRFRVVSQLSHGSLADVYLCRLVGVAGFEKDVVVKRIVAEHAADPHFVELFLEEARVVARLEHPNVVEVYESGVEDGQPYIAMEYIRGVDLVQIIARAHQEGRPAYQLLAAIMAGVSDGLAYAHGALDGDGEHLGLVHRDIRPLHIIVSFEGIPKLLEFGMATARGRLSRAHSAVFRESLRYMAPEQISQGQVDQRADVFGLGATLYELTTGRNPFGAEGDPEVQVLDRILNGIFPRPTEIVPGYPPALEDIVLSALQPEVHQRCPSAAELRDRLMTFVEAEGQPADARQIAGWLRRLFPDPTRPDPTPSPRMFDRTPPPPLGLPPARPARPFLQAQMAPVRPPQASPPGRAFKWTALGALAVALAVGVWGLGRRPPPAALVLAPAPALRQASRAYLEAAQDLIADRRYGGARELLVKAEGLDPDAQPRLRQLRRQIDEALARGEPASPAPPPPPVVEATPAPAPPAEPARPPSARHKGRSREMAAAERRGRGGRAHGKRKGDDAAAELESPFTPPAPLPLVTSIVDAGHLARVCQQVEEALAARAGVPADYARGITATLRQRVAAGAKVYPSAMYSFVIRQHAAGRDRATVSAALAAAQAEGSLH
jgi:serine/threonine protein kinase